MKKNNKHELEQYRKKLSKFYSDKISLLEKENKRLILENIRLKQLLKNANDEIRYLNESENVIYSSEESKLKNSSDLLNILSIDSLIREYYKIINKGGN